MKKLSAMLIIMVFLLLGCSSKQKDSRIKLQEGVASDTAGSNIVTKPFLHIYSAITGERIEFAEPALRRNSADILEVQVNFYNKSYNTVRFQYIIEWLDKDGLTINSKTNIWHNMSVAGKSNGVITGFAPNASAVDFKMNTRDQQ